MDLLLAYNPFLLITALAVAGAFAWWSYGRMVPTVPAASRALLAGLRACVLGLVILLLFEPILQRITVREEAPVVAVLIDDTRSLAPHDSGGPGKQHARLALADMPALDADVRFFSFTSELNTIEAPDSLRFDGARTDISAALDQVSRRLQGRNLRGVVLLSDGRYNTGRNPLQIAERFPVPIYTVVLGDTTRPRDVSIDGVLSNEIAYVGVELPVQVTVQSDGFAGEQATVTLSEGGRILDSESITLPADGLQTNVELRFTPEEEGLRRYGLSLSRFEGEATHANNSAGLMVRVLSTRRQILLLTGAPGPDVAAIRQELETDPNVELTVRTPRRDGSFYEGPWPARLGDYDLAVLAGFPGPVTPGVQAQAIAQAAAGGLPLLFVLTRQTNLQMLDSALGEHLPASPQVIRPAFLEAQIDPTAAGAVHPVLSIPGAPAGGLERLPPVLANESRWIAAPDARTLATKRVQGVALDDPLLVVRQRGSARSAALLAAGTWRWRTLPPDLDHLASFYPGVVQNMVRWLTAREDTRPVRVRPHQDLFDAAEPVRLAGQVYDESLTPVSDADVHVVVREPDGGELPFTMRPLGNGRFELDAGTLPAGDYRYAASAERQGVLLGTDEGAFAVGVLDLELRDLYADVALMREMARRSGGASVLPEQVASLGPLLADRMVSRPVPSTSDTELWRLMPLLGLLVGLLSTEWILRKRAGMV